MTQMGTLEDRIGWPKIRSVGFRIGVGIRIRLKEIGSEAKRRRGFVHVNGFRKNAWHGVGNKAIQLRNELHRFDVFRFLLRNGLERGTTRNEFRRDNLALAFFGLAVPGSLVVESERVVFQTKRAVSERTAMRFRLACASFCAFTQHIELLRLRLRIGITVKRALLIYVCRIGSGDK